MLTTCTIRQERWGEFWREAEPLMHQHHCEVGTHGIKFVLAQDVLCAADANGAMRYWIARSNGMVVGYIMWFCNSHIFAGGMFVAQMGPWYVAPAHRRHELGERLLIHSLRDLRDAGCKMAFPHHQSVNAEALERLFIGRGAVPYEVDYVMWLDRADLTPPQAAEASDGVY